MTLIKLQSLYKYYHRLFKCYQWKYLKLKKNELVIAIDIYHFGLLLVQLLVL